ncbi:MAG: hypothetical protein ACI89J_001253 [Hyphomicrobiaceae bacterium]|jgi:hypothetical protein
MHLLRIIVDVFLWPGDQARKALGITVEQDGGLLRSLINMLVWGTVSLGIALMIVDF